VRWLCFRRPAESAATSSWFRPLEENAERFPRAPERPPPPSQRRALCQSLELVRVGEQPRAHVPETGQPGCVTVSTWPALIQGVGGLRGPPQLDVGRVSNFPPAHPTGFKNLTAHAACWSAPRDRLRPREPGRAEQSCPARARHASAQLRTLDPPLRRAHLVTGPALRRGHSAPGGTSFPEDCRSGLSPAVVGGPGGQLSSLRARSVALSRVPRVYAVQGVVLTHRLPGNRSDVVVDLLADHG
jgi:hypothetical protein